MILALFAILYCYYDEIIGIDFGSTTSCVSYFDNDKVKIIQNERGNSNTPSVASLVGNDMIKGEDAKRQMIPNPKNTFYAIKKLIGFENMTNFTNFKFDVIKNNNQLIIYKHGGKEKFSLGFIASEILKSLKDLASKNLGKEIKRAVITVPAYFNEKQIEIIMKASEMAGFIQKKIIKEPIASVIAYGLNKKGCKPQKIIVYHLGGYTHDVTLLSIEDSYIKVLDSQVTDDICGYNFDNRIVDYLLKSFKERSGINASEDLNAIAKLWFKVEKAKKAFFYLPKVRIMIGNFFNGYPLSEKITLEKFEEINEDLFQNSLNLLKIVLKKANVTKDEIDGIILSGGSTKLPQIQKIISNFFSGKKIYSDINPEEVVAYGAALEAGALSGNDKSRDIIKMNPYSFYIKTDDGKNLLMIHDNTNVPIKETRRFNFSTNNQDYFHFEIYVGINDETSDFVYLNEINITNKKPNGYNTFIDVTYEFYDNFTLKVTAKNNNSKKTINIDVEFERNDFANDYYKKLVSKKIQEIKTLYTINLNELKELKKKNLDQIKWFTVLPSRVERFGIDDNYLHQILVECFRDIFPEIFKICSHHQWMDEEQWHSYY
ncbi:hypothetical protein M9Y10_019899 [Tritrichomonas musculus]|uniref:Heat shock protein 70 n=1 Tax=Tritrichomonas musculus TaxID=1915356 RepID=A0ABR2HHL1_9EUKA